MVILLSFQRNVPIRAIYLLLLTKKNFWLSLHNRNNRYTRGGHAIPVANNARIYSTIKDLSVGEARVTEGTGRFPDSSAKIKNALIWFHEENDGISLTLS